jgi:hypothetical protein
MVEARSSFGSYIASHLKNALGWHCLSRTFDA